MDDPGELERIALFRGLTADDLERVRGLWHRKSLPPRVLLMTSDQPGEAVYVILEGTAKIFLSRDDGGEVILAILGAGQTVGEMSLLDSAGRSANVLTLEPSAVLWTDRVAFRRCLDSMPALSLNLARLLSERLRMANEQILALSSLDVTGRVARQILAFADQYGEADPAGEVRIPLRLTQADLAAVIGTSRERVNHAIVFFKERGYISVDGRHHISIHDRRSLADRCR